MLKSMEKNQLPPGYEIREMTKEEFQPLWQKHSAPIFHEDGQIFSLWDALSDEEKAKGKQLGENMGKPWQLRLGLFHRDEFVGWACGDQKNFEEYYMRNSAVLPEHRRKGLYQALLQKTVDIVVEKGFQRIYSRHNATNNAVIIPKLKFGFVISSLEVSDIFGVLVHLAYYPKEIRRKMMDYRVGDCKPDAEIRRLLKL
jgi:ribosomal protein S18 acetylase RimI-like enzyme